MKEQVVELCKGLEDALNYKGGNHTVRLRSGPITNGWIAHILVDNQIIYKQNYYYKEPNGIDCELYCLTKIMQEVFNYGVMASKQELEKYSSQSY